MRKKLLIIAVLAIMSFSLIFAVACDKEFTELTAKDENLGNYEGLDVAEGAHTTSLWKRITTG